MRKLVVTLFYHLQICYNSILPVVEFTPNTIPEFHYNSCPPLCQTLAHRTSTDKLFPSSLVGTWQTAVQLARHFYFLGLSRVSFCKLNRILYWQLPNLPKRREERETLTSLTETEEHYWHCRSLYKSPGDAGFIQQWIFMCLLTPSWCSISKIKIF